MSQETTLQDNPKPEGTAPVKRHRGNYPKIGPDTRTITIKLSVSAAQRELLRAAGLGSADKILIFLLEHASPEGDGPTTRP